MAKQVYQIRGLDCPDCAASLGRAVQGLEGVREAHVDMIRSEMWVDSDSDAALIEEIEALVTGMGYALVDGDEADRGGSPAEGASVWRRIARDDWYTISGLILLVAGAILWLAGVKQPWYAGVWIAATIVAGAPVARSGWLGIRYGRTLDMNALMTIAGLGALAVGEFAEGAITMVLFSVGELLEGYTAKRARDSVRSLLALAPMQALRLSPSGEEEVDVESLEVDDRVRIRPGERVAADGVIVEGSSELDQSSVTGESMPVPKGLGDSVLAGTLNGVGVLTVQVVRRAQDSTLQRIKRLIEEAQAQRAPIQRFVDRFARVYTPVVVALAVVIAAVPPLLGWGTISEWGYKALVMLCIACPCALVISTPVTLVSGLARMAKGGVLIKGGDHLETLAQLDAIAWDKTGTLSEGRPRVLGAGCDRAAPGEPCEQCDLLLARAAAVEAHSEHSLGRAIREHAERVGVWQQGMAGEAVRALTGRGIVGQIDGHTVTIGNKQLIGGHQSPGIAQAVEAEEASGRTVLLVEDSCCDARCYLVLEDSLRPEARQVVDTLRHQGVKRQVMLTGDSQQVAAKQASLLGIDGQRAELLPEDKVAAVEELLERHATVAMVGDGVNDAPALARASVGIAMGAAGTDVALETADVALMGDDLRALPFAVGLAKRTMGILRANIVFALVLKALFMVLAAKGYASLWMAVLADTGASLLVSLNGLRLLRHRAASWLLGQGVSGQG